MNNNGNTGSNIDDTWFNNKTVVKINGGVVVGGKVV